MLRHISMANRGVSVPVRTQRTLVVRFVYGLHAFWRFIPINNPKRSWKRLRLLDQLGLATLGQRGQTLVDLTVAITLLTLALLSAGALATTAAKASVIAGQRTQATALATRELEALRNYRDSIAKYNEPWSIIPSGSCNPGTGASFIIQADNSNPQIPWNLVTVSDGKPVAYSNNDDTGYGAYSMFSRLVTVCDSPTSTDAKSVQVKVVWPAGQVQFTTIITNWKTSS